jgi:alkylated DNA repair dioxygenase AlkB
MNDHSLIPTSLGDVPAPAAALRTVSMASGAAPARGLGAGDSSYFPGVFLKEEADAMLARLMPGGEIPYQQWFHMPDPKHPRRALRPLSRIKVAMAVPDERGWVPHYRFPVNDQHRHGVIAPMTPTVDGVRRRVEALTGERFNHAVALVYRDGGDCIGFHKDKTLDLDPTAPIASVSLGAVRPLRLRDDIFTPTIEYELLFEHGAVFVLGPRSNTEFYHAIPRLEGPSPTGPRVSLTFRRALTFRDAEGRLHGQGARYESLNWPAELKGLHRLDLDLPIEQGGSVERSEGGPWQGG